VCAAGGRLQKLRQALDPIKSSLTPIQRYALGQDFIMQACMMHVAGKDYTGGALLKKGYSCSKISEVSCCFILDLSESILGDAQTGILIQLQPVSHLLLKQGTFLRCAKRNLKDHYTKNFVQTHPQDYNIIRSSHCRIKRDLNHSPWFASFL